MKKIISAILVLAMFLSLMGGITVSAAATAKEYHFALDRTNASEGGLYGVTKNEAGWTSGGFRNFSAFQVTGFGDHGWYTFAVDYDDADTDVYYRMAQIANQYISIRKYYMDKADYESSTEKHNLSGIKFSVMLEAPAAGYYQVSVNTNKAGNKIYMAKFNEAEQPDTASYTNANQYKKNLSIYYASDSSCVGNSVVQNGLFANGVIASYPAACEKVVYSDGTTPLVFTLENSVENEATLSALKFIPASGTAELKLDSNRIMIGETTKAAFKVGTNEVVSSFVTYGVEGENPCVTVDSETGEITANSTGTATITATLADNEIHTATVEVVKNWEYHFSNINGTSTTAGGKYGVDTKGAGFTTASDQWHGFRVTGFGNHGWYSYAVDHDGETVFAVNMLQVRDNCTYLFANKNELKNLKAAFVLKAPAKGFYIVRENTNSAGNTFYISKADASVAPQTSMTDYTNYRKDLDGYAIEKNFVGDSVANASGFTSLGTISYNDLKKVIYSDGESDLLLVVNVPGDLDTQFRAVQLEAINTAANVKVEKTSLEIGDITTAELISSNRAFVNSFVDWSVEKGTSVSIDDCGNITAESAGTSTIKATVGGVSYTATVTVTAPVVEPEEEEPLVDEFVKEEEMEAVSYIAPTVTGLTLNGKTIESEYNEEDGTYNLTAPKTEKKFLYWAMALSGNKRIVSFSETLENYVPEGNYKNYLVPVYEGDVDTSKDEYYNQNGQLIPDAEQDTIVSMPGYGNSNGWDKYSDNIYVAHYDKTAAQRDKVTVTVIGGEGTAENVPFGTKVTCTATEEDNDGNPFKCWKKEVNGVSEIVSVDSTYIFKAWETCTVEAVYEEHTPVSTAMKIIIDSFAVGSDTGVMAEFIGLDDAVEKGIMFTATGETEATKIAMTTKGNQFTVIADEEGKYVGYAILKSGSTYQLITDGSYIKQEE